MRTGIFQWLFIALLIAGVQISWAQTLPEQVTSVSPSWETFTNEDGTGLYHEILAEIFTPLGIRVTHTYTNANRGVQMVRKGLADMYTCRSDTEGFPDLMLARYPMYEGRFYAFFKKAGVKEWQGVATLEGKKIVWRRGYYRPSEFKATFSVFETDSGELALTQVLLGRGDFYIDDLNLIKSSIAKSSIPVPMESCDIRVVGSRTYHPVFKTNVRGKQIMALYDQGIERLHRSGKLKQIFQKWHHPYPAYPIP